MAVTFADSLTKISYAAQPFRNLPIRVPEEIQDFFQTVFGKKFKGESELDGETLTFSENGVTAVLNRGEFCNVEVSVDVEPGSDRSKFLRKAIEALSKGYEKDQSVKRFSIVLPLPLTPTKTAAFIPDSFSLAGPQACAITSSFSEDTVTISKSFDMESGPNPTVCLVVAALIDRASREVFVLEEAGDNKVTWGFPTSHVKNSDASILTAVRRAAATKAGMELSESEVLNLKFIGQIENSQNGHQLYQFFAYVEDGLSKKERQSSPVPGRWMRIDRIAQNASTLGEFCLNPKTIPALLAALEGKGNFTTTLTKSTTHHFLT